MPNFKQTNNYDSSETTQMQEVLETLGVQGVNPGTSTGSKWFESSDKVYNYSPVDGQLIGGVKETTKDEYEMAMQTAADAFKEWRKVPAPQRRN